MADCESGELAIDSGRKRPHILETVYRIPWKILCTNEVDYLSTGIYDKINTKRLYAVKAQTSLAPLSRFRGSLVTTVHAQECCRFQSYAKSVPSPMKLTSEIDKA